MATGVSLAAAHMVGASGAEVVHRPVTDARIRIWPGEARGVLPGPPGSFLLGRTRKVSHTEFIAYKGDVTKNYTISVKKGKGRVWTAELHVNYSYEEVIPVGEGELDKSFYVCQGDDAFRFIV